MDMRRLTLAIGSAAAIILTACGGDPAKPQGDGDQGRVSTVRGLSGTLYFERDEPLEYTKIMSMDMKSGRYAVAADGLDPSSWGKSIAFIQHCSPLAVRLAVTDTDGFAIPVSECQKLDTISPDFYRPSISRNGKKIAIPNTAILLPKDELPDTAAARFGIGDNTYAALQIYNLDGGLETELRGLGVATWMKDGTLIATGLTEEAGFGIHKVNKKLNASTRIDDGRITGPIFSIDAHPTKNRVIFIYNGQIFEMDLKRGKPKRIHSHGHPLSAVTYSPDGKKIAFVSADPLDEAMETPGSGYSLFILDDGKVEDIRIPFIPGGPMDWVK